MTRVVVVVLALALGVAVALDDGTPERRDACAGPVATAHTEALIWRLSYDACLEGWRECVGANAARLYWPIVLRRR